MTHVDIFVLFNGVLKVQVVVANVVSSRRKLLVALTTPFYFWLRKPCNGAFEFRDLPGECRDFWNRCNDKVRLG